MLSFSLFLFEHKLSYNFAQMAYRIKAFRSQRICRACLLRHIARFLRDFCNPRRGFPDRIVNTVHRLGNNFDGICQFHNRVSYGIHIRTEHVCILLVLLADLFKFLVLF